MADEIGHNLEVHMCTFVRFMTCDLADAFAAVNGSNAKEQKVKRKRFKT